jgi:hypothetical protein
LAQGLEFRVADLEQQGVDAGKGLSKTIGDILQADDKLLSSLQKLGRELDQQDPSEARNVEKLRETCMRYASWPALASNHLNYVYLKIRKRAMLLNVFLLG